MISYSVGECANSLLMNSIFGFAMLYYTDALGLSPALAGLAMAVAVFWDALTDPVMGHVTDNTRSRFGRRHPYILGGGVAVVVVFLFLWYVPSYFKASEQALFWYLVVINLLQRTAITVYGVPYIALGFEICTDYDGRVKLQGIRSALNMVANLLGPALAWSLFFSDNDVSRATSRESNYTDMGLAFAVVSLACILYVVVATRHYARDSRHMKFEGHGLRGFIRDMKETAADAYARYVFLFIVVVSIGIAMVSTMQMYLYEHFMRFGGVEKSIAHGGTMVGFMTGALTGGFLARRLEKKGAVYFGGALSVGSNFILGGLFLTGLLSPGQTFGLFGWQFPIAFVAFVLFQALYWMGNGIMFPTSISMMADVSEIHEIQTGVNKDGSYSAVYSFSQKVAISVGMLVTGVVLSFIGFESGAGVVQRPDVLWNLCAVTLLAGPAISLTSLVLIGFYPITREFLREARAGRERTG
jgi:GPH family glycoside/pentoside/hexuronide:cation symporter